MANISKLSKEKIKAYEEAEKIDAMGQDSDKKAVKYIKQAYDEQEQQEQLEQKKLIEETQKKLNSPKIFTYKESVAIRLAELLREESFPPNYHWKIEIIDHPHAIRLDIFSSDGKFKRSRGFKLLLDRQATKYELHACTVLAYWAGDTILKEIDNAKVTKGGIYLPS